MQVSSSDGVTVAVHDLGGDGDPFLICHATGFCGRAYEPFAAELSGRFHVWAMDFRGHGDATAPANGRFDWTGMADDMLAVVGALTAEPIAVFGHSMGGGVSLLVEERQPGTLRSAYLYEPIIVPAQIDADWAPPIDNPMGTAARRRRATFASKAEALLRYASRPPLEELRAGSLAAYVEHGFEDVPDGTVRLKCAPEHEAATFEAGGKPTIEQIAAVQTPTIVAAGRTEGDWSPAVFAPLVAGALPNGRLVVHPTMGHFGPLQDPVTIAEQIVATA
jgi:pimeloyl-ACP methyl ester carboxylesterase